MDIGHRLETSAWFGGPVKAQDEVVPRKGPEFSSTVPPVMLETALSLGGTKNDWTANRGRTVQQRQRYGKTRLPNVVDGQ